MLNDSGSARHLRETYTLVAALNAATHGGGAHADRRIRLRRCLRAYLDRILESGVGFLYLPGGRSAAFQVGTAEHTRKFIVERFVHCATGPGCRGPLEPLVEGWLALAESMFGDWMESGAPSRDHLEDVLCDLFFVAADTAHQNDAQDCAHQESG